MDMNSIFKVKTAWDNFVRNHPKFPMFLNAAKSAGITEGTIIAVSITEPDGKVIDTNIKVTAQDLELFNTLKDIRP